MTNKAEQNEADAARRESLNLYSAVSICCGDESCKAATTIEGQRYLTHEAPTLPLARCESGNCGCHYFSYRDRRNFLTSRRSSDVLEAHPDKRFLRNNRRGGSERRKLKVSFN